MKSKKKKGARLGQHFLTGGWAAAKLVESAKIVSGDTVLEVGPGKGALTKELLRTPARIVAIEKDPALVETLKEKFQSEVEDKKLVLIEQDIRDLDLEDSDLGSYVVAANIPYYITGEIIRLFLSARAQPKTLALLVQKEVADRIVARGGKESILSISVKAYGAPEIAAKVARGNFSPAPSVDSAILVVRNISKKFFADFEEESFFEIVRAGFSSKRKLLASNLGAKFGRDRTEAALAGSGAPEKTRAEDVSLSGWKSIAKELLR